MSMSSIKELLGLPNNHRNTILFIGPECSASISYCALIASLAFRSLVFCPLWKRCPGRRRVEEKDFRSVIQRHRVNASILFLTTGVNCRSDSPTHSTFLLEGEAETLRMKWDEKCSKRCCSCPVLTPVLLFMLPSFPPRTWATTLTSMFAEAKNKRRTTSNKAKCFISSSAHLRSIMQYYVVISSLIK